MTNETLTERVDAISQVIYDPSGKQSGEYYPANSTHFFGKPIKSVKVQSSSSGVSDEGNIVAATVQNPSR